MEGFSECYGHRDDLREQRQRNAAKGGRSGGRGRGSNGELAAVKDQIRRIIGGVLDGSIETAPGAVAIQGTNALIRSIEAERRTFDLQDLLQRLDALEERAERLRGA